MKRTLLAVSIAAAFLVAGCSSSDSTPEAATTMTMPSSTVAETSSATAAPVTEAAAAPQSSAANQDISDTPSYEQMCKELIEYVDTVAGLSGQPKSEDSREEILDGMLAQSKTSPEFQNITPAEQERTLQAYAAAKRGKC